MRRAALYKNFIIWYNKMTMYAKEVFSTSRRIWVLTITLLAALCMLPAASYAESPYPRATINPDASSYDSEHPEKLEPDQLYAWSAVLMEAKSGRIIFEKDPDTLRHPASTTKILTILLGCTMVEDVNMTVTVSERAAMVEDPDSSLMNLRAGEEIPFIDVLYGAALLSGNDAANVIAETVSGSVENFVELMNNYVSTLGCENTHFNNPHGLTDPYHYTTAADMAKITQAAMSNSLFRQIVASTSYTVSKTNMTRAHTISNGNILLINGTEENPNKYYYPYAIGVKTGTTNAAQYCLVSAAEKDGVELISVVYYSDKNTGRWRDTIRLFDFGFSQYTSVSPIDLYNMNPITIETSNFALDDPDRGKLRLACTPQNVAASLRAQIVATNDEVDAMSRNLRNTVIISYDRDFIAPVESGEVMGTMTYFTESGEAVVYNLTATRSIARRENAPKSLNELIAEIEADPNPFPPLTLELIFIYLFLPVLTIAVAIQLLYRLFKRKRRHAAKAPRVVHRYMK